MKGTGIFATKEELEQLMNSLNTPVIKVGSYVPRSPVERCHELALKHGLPEITGYYGIKQDGEFVTE